MLSALDRAAHGLELDALASAVLCTIEQRQDGTVLRWSNAGHPPPLLLPPFGPAQLLHTDPELLLGLDPNTPRTDHSVTLAPGSMTVLFTDGLIERRGESLDEGLARLRELVTDLGPQHAESLADALLHRLAEEPEADVALLILSVR